MSNRTAIIIATVFRIIATGLTAGLWGYMTVAMYPAVTVAIRTGSVATVLGCVAVYALTITIGTALAVGIWQATKWEPAN